MNLFDRIPHGLFAALTGRNNRRAWDLLVRLSDRYFGPDAVPPYPDGYLHDQIVKEIERFLLDAGWEHEGDDPVPERAPRDRGRRRNGPGHIRPAPARVLDAVKAMAGGARRTARLTHRPRQPEPLVSRLTGRRANIRLTGRPDARIA